MVSQRRVDKGDDLYLVPAEGDPLPPVGSAVRGAVEDERRTALMRTHSGLHVLCGVVFRDFGALVTGGNMEPLTARMDFNLPDVPPGFREAVESACNAELLTDRRVDVRVLSACLVVPKRVVGRSAAENRGNSGLSGTSGGLSATGSSAQPESSAEMRSA